MGKKAEVAKAAMGYQENPSNCQGQIIFLDISFKPVIHLARSFLSHHKKEKDSLTRKFEFVTELKNDSRSAPYPFPLQDCFQIQIGNGLPGPKPFLLGGGLNLMIANHSLAIERKPVRNCPVSA